MPHLRFRAINKEEINRISGDLVHELSQLIGCPKDHFTLEYLESSYIIKGGSSEPYPFVEVLWFSRGQEIQDKVAQEITKQLKKSNDYLVCVVFIDLEPNSYYEDGVHY